MSQAPQRFTTRYGQVVWQVAQKDLRAEFRAREIVSAMLLFAFLSVVIFSLALELNRQERRDSVAGVLWVTITFAGMIGLSRSMSVEKDKGSLDALLIAPIPRSALFYGKMLANLAFTLMVGLMLLVLLTFLFNVTLLQPAVLGVLVLGTLGFTAAGTLLSSLSIYARGRENLLPIILLPVVLPLLLCAVRATSALLNGFGMDEWGPWLQLLLMVDVAFLVLTFFLFDVVVEES
jgi:heme exporter protein B